MNKKRALVIASVIIGICAGYIFSQYLYSPRSFNYITYLPLIFIISGMVVYIIGHLIKKKNTKFIGEN